jgi:hypothetical protein
LIFAIIPDYADDAITLPPLADIFDTPDAISAPAMTPFSIFRHAITPR